MKGDFTVPFFYGVPMNITSVIETTFSASHSVEGHPICEDRHGHTWRVRVEIAGDETAMEAVATITGLIRQYHHRDLDRFLPGVETHTSGLCAFFRERLSDFPVTAIEVLTDEGAGTRMTWATR